MIRLILYNHVNYKMSLFLFILKFIFSINSLIVQIIFLVKLKKKHYVISVHVCIDENCRLNILKNIFTQHFYLANNKLFV